MLHRFLVLAIGLGLWGCSDEAEIAELKAYVKSVQEFDHFNVSVEGYINTFDDPSNPVTEQDVNTARQLVDDYAQAVRDITDPDSNALRHTHSLYARCFDDARRLARDETGDIKRQAHSVVIGLRNLRRDIRDRVYQSIEVLLERKGIDYRKGSEHALPWIAE